MSQPISVQDIDMTRRDTQRVSSHYN